MLKAAEAYGLNLLFPAGDTAIGPSLSRHGEFSRVELEFLLDHAPEPSGSLIDVGANIGSVGLPFARSRPGWRVQAVEAHRGLATVLAANVVNNGLHRVEVHHAAAAHTVAVAPFPQPRLDEARNYGEVGFHMKEEPLEQVRMLTIDSIASSDLRLVKVDVEGAEGYVLKGAQRVLAEQRAIWVCEAGTSRPEVVARFLSERYDVYWFYVPFVTGTPARGGPPDDPGRGDVNVVAVPPGATLRWDLRRVTAPDEPRPDDAAGYPYLARYSPIAGG